MSSPAPHSPTTAPPQTLLACQCDPISQTDYPLSRSRPRCVKIAKTKYSKKMKAMRKSGVMQTFANSDAAFGVLENKIAEFMDDIDVDEAAVEEEEDATSIPALVKMPQSKFEEARAHNSISLQSLATRHSTLDTRHSTLDTRHSTLDSRHSIFILTPCHR